MLKRGLRSGREFRDGDLELVVVDHLLQSQNETTEGRPVQFHGIFVSFDVSIHQFKRRPLNCAFIRSFRLILIVLSIGGQLNGVRDHTP